MADEDLLIRSPDASAAGAVQGRALPANLEAEAAFLGAVLIDNVAGPFLRTRPRPHL